MGVRGHVCQSLQAGIGAASQLSRGSRAGTRQPLVQRLPVPGAASWALPGNPPCGEESGLLWAKWAANEQVLGRSERQLSAHAAGQICHLLNVFL